MSTILTCGARADVRKMAASGQVAPLRERSVGIGEKGRAAAGIGTGGRVPSNQKESADAAGARAGCDILQKQFPHVFVPKHGEDISFEEWYWKELREGGVLQQYIAQERDERATRRRYRTVARTMDGFQQNNRSDFQLKAAVPLRDYFRWKATDPHFFEDDGNLRSLKRDNPDVVVKV
jgi:hypothetical protein